MALERIGLGGILTFNADKAIGNMGRAEKAFGRLKSRADRVGGGLKMAGQGATVAAAGMLPLTLAMGAGVAKAADFEQQMSAVGAVANASESDMARLTAEAKKQGVVSTFSASQSAQAMEFMARAGASTDEVIGGLSGVINAAAAESLDLATATDVVAQTTKIMGREWSQSSNTADVLVRASQLANTNVVALGEAMKFGGANAVEAGLTFEETAAIMAKLADNGLRGSAGGTALTNALNKLGKPTGKAQKLMQKLGLEMSRTASGGVDIVKISADLAKKLEQIENPLERTAITTEIFGVRGKRAFASLAKAGVDGTNTLLEQLQKASEGEGAAAEAAAKRLDNLKGAFTLLTSSLEGVAIELFGPMLGPMKEFVQGFTEGLNDVILGIQTIMAGGESTNQIALGVVDAIHLIQDAFNQVRAGVSKVVEFMSQNFGGEGSRNIAKVATVLGVVAAAVAPIILGLSMVAFWVSSALIPLFVGLKTVLAATFWPVTLAIGALVLGFQLFRTEGETTGQALARLWLTVKTAAMSVWNDAILPLWEGIKAGLVPAIQQMGAIWDGIVLQIKAIWAQLVAEFSSSTEGMSVDFMEVGRVIGAVMGTIGTVISEVLGFAITLIGAVVVAAVRLGKAIWNNIYETFAGVVSALDMVWQGITKIFSGDIMSGLGQLGKGLFNLVLEPLKQIVRTAIGLADALGAGNLVPTSLRDFSRSLPEPPQAVSARGGGGKLTPAREQTNNLGAGATAAKASNARKANAPGNVAVNATLKDSREININNKLTVAGSEMAVASGRHKQEIGERSGFKTTPWQRRVRLEQGALPTG